MGHIQYNHGGRCLSLCHPCAVFATHLGGNDYAGEGFSVAFSIGDTVISFNIPIVDDDVVEASEQFSLRLEIPDKAASSGITKGTQYATANVTIVNDDG